MRLPLFVPLFILPVALAGCMSPGGGDEGGSTLGNLLRYGGTTAPPAAVVPSVAYAECPPVTVNEGGAAVRVSGGDSVRSQIAISNVARECVERADGAVVVKVGVEGRVLLGPGGAPGRFEAPLTFTVRRGEQVFASRSRRVPLTVPAGDVTATFSTVEGDLVVPAGTGEFEIEVALGNGGTARKAPAPRRRSRA